MYCPACGHLNLPGNDECGKCGTPLAHLDGPNLNDRLENSLVSDPVSVLNPRPPVTIPADAPLSDAMRRMIDLGVGAVLVTDAAERLVGILTERDFLLKIAGQPRFEELPVSQFMTAAPETVGPKDTLSFVVGKMDAGGYRHLPVVEAGKPVGVISVRDILRHITGLCQDA